MDNKDKVQELLWQNILRYEKQIADVNTKATYLITASIFLMGIAFSVFTKDSDSIKNVVLFGYATKILYAIFMISGAIAVYHSFESVYPKTDKSKTNYIEQSCLYFGDTGKYSSGKLIENIEGMIAKNALNMDYEAQCIIMASLVTAKFESIKKSFKWLKIQSAAFFLMIVVYSVFKVVIK
jgi:hypothetical protein